VQLFRNSHSGRTRPATTVSGFVPGGAVSSEAVRPPGLVHVYVRDDRSFAVNVLSDCRYQASRWAIAPAPR
jgi:hypothetical protein